MLSQINSIARTVQYNLTKSTLVRSIGNLNKKYDYDLLVIGGGSGGRACAAEAIKYDAKVALLDYVDPSTQGSIWGLGGTCVNVGCIPKKIFHYASRLREAEEDMRVLGIEIPEKVSFNWNALVETSQDHIHSLNFGAKSTLKTSGIDYIYIYIFYYIYFYSYINSRGSFKDPHTIEATDSKGNKNIITSDKIVIATGGRPQIPSIPGAREYGITSDDLFTLSHPPGKTLVVGASYIALECAGVLRSLGYDTYCMVRSRVLRKFDQDMAEHVQEHMSRLGVKFLQPAIPTSIDKINDKEYMVKYTDTDSNITKGEVYNTVMFAIGRNAATQSLHCERAGVELQKNGGHVITSNDLSGYMQSTQSNIYAIGDARFKNIELTPVAIHQGIHLARHLFTGEDISGDVDFRYVPSSVFTPLEYSFVGISEEEALQKYGEGNIEVYMKKFNTLEQKACMREGTEEGLGFIKIITEYNSPQRILGIHMIGHQTSDTIQGLAVAMKKGLTKEDLESSIPIHPTEGEEIFRLPVTRRSNGEILDGKC
ncbi:hypothetical protein WA158_002515 [Blastocystis sp. Blastoise]